MSLEAGQAQTVEEAKAQLSQEVNAVLAPSGIAVSEADIAISNYTQATDSADGGFDYSVKVNTGEQTQTISGKAVIRATPVEARLVATAASGYYDNGKQKAKENRWSFALADGSAKFDIPGREVKGWTSSKPKAVSIDRETGEAAFLKKGNNILITAQLSDGTALSKRIDVVDMASQIKLQWKKGRKWVDFAQETPSVRVGKKLTVRVSPVSPSSGAAMLGLAWEVGDGLKAANAKKGRSKVLKGQAEGEATVNATLFNGVSATGSVNVVQGKDSAASGIKAITVIREETAEEGQGENDEAA